MPLEKGHSRVVIGHNISTEEAAGKPRNQAIAIALHTAHPHEKKKKKKTAIQRRAESLNF